MSLPAHQTIGAYCVRRQRVSPCSACGGRQDHLGRHLVRGRPRDRPGRRQALPPIAGGSALLARDVREAPSHLAIVVNDVQRAGPLLGELWRLIATISRQFILLGSSVCPLRTSGPQLATHAPPLTMFPLVPAELGRDFSLDRVLRFGSLPAIWEAADPGDALDEHVQAYVHEEIRGDAAVRNLPAFLRFLPVAALAHGQVVNVAALARDAATSRTTVDGYLAVLRDTLVATLLPAFEPRLRVRERRHPKLYWTDAGVVRAMKGQLGEVSAEERPALIEGLALTVLRAHNHRGEIFDDIGYWSPGQARSTDVDFLLRRGRDFWRSKSTRARATSVRTWPACAPSPACRTSCAACSYISGIGPSGRTRASTSCRSPTGSTPWPRDSCGRRLN